MFDKFSLQSTSNPTPVTVISQVRPKTSILDKSLSKKRGEVSLSCYALLFSELVQYCQNKVHTVPELQAKLCEMGQEVGIKLIDLYFVRERNCKREIKLLNMLLFIKTTLWKGLFGKEADKLEHANDDERIYYLIEKEPLVNKFISVPKDKGSLNCAMFIAGIVEGILNASGFTAKVTAHWHKGTTYMVQFDESVIIKDKQIVTADYYLCAPVNDLDPTYSSFGFCAVTQVPVIRIFGVTPTGEKACIHIHGVLPYIYVPFPVGSNASGLMYQMGNELDSALNKAIDVSYHKKHIFKMSLVSGIPFYGYHSKNQDFIKIFFYHPYTVKKAVQILQSGIICNQKFQPHESHVPYILQFFIDYNLYGMSFLNLSECFFRRSQTESEMSVGGSQSLIKISNCQIEVDAIAEKIMNKETVAESTVANPGLAQIWEEEKDRRRKEGLPSQAEQEESQERRNSPTASDMMYREELLLGLKRRQEEEIVSPELVPESVASQEASFREDHSSQRSDGKPPIDVALDEQDMALIQMLMTRFQEEETPEDDSILGSQEPAEDASDSEADLTLPLLLPEEDNEEVDIFSGCEVVQTLPLDEREPELSDTLMWPELEGLSQIDGQSDSSQSKTSSKILQKQFLNKNKNDKPTKPFEFLFIDGSIDDDELGEMKTPEKKKKKIKHSPHRYRPLDVRMYKSPRKQVEKQEEEPRVSSPELFRKFEQSVSEINRKIRSPSHSPVGNKSKIVDSGEDNEKNKTRKKIKDVLNKGRLLRKRYNSLPVELLKKTKIVEETEPSEGEDSSGNTNSHDLEKLFSESDIMKMKKEVVYAKKVLFEESVPKDSNDSGNMCLPCLDDSVRKVTFKEGSLVVTISPGNGSPSDETFANNLSESVVDEQQQQIHVNQVEYLEMIEAEGKSGHGKNSSQDKDDKKLENQSAMEESFFDVTVNSQSACVSFYDNTLGLLSDCTIAQTPSSDIYTPLSNPPTREEVLKNLNVYNLGASEPIIPYNGDPSDPSSSKEIGLQVVRLGSKFARDLEEFEGTFVSGLQQSHIFLIKQSSALEKVKVQVIASQRKVVLFPAKDPPTASDAKEWCESIKNKDKPNLKEPELEMDLTEMSFECSQADSILSLSQESLPDSQSTPIFGKALRLKISSRSRRSLFRDSLPPIDEEAESHIDKKIHQEGVVVVPKNTSTEMSPLLDSRTNSLAIDNVTPDNSGAFKLDFQNLQQGQPSTVYKYLTVFILEVFTVTRGSLHPDPQHDAIQAAFYTITNDVPPSCHRPRQMTGFIMVCPPSEDFRRSTQSCDWLKVPTESDLYTKVIGLVTKHDPDIIAGYEIERGSWGYLIERGYVLGLNLLPQLSRIAQDPRLQGMSGTKTQVSDYEMKIPGRIILNVWRLMRHEVALLSYTFENMMYHVLHTRVPYFTYQTLSSWWSHSSLFYRDLTVEYFLTRVLGTERLLDQLDLIGRTSELASLFGIQFYEVLSRGSQFRVESMMLRLAKPMNYIPVSPSVQQRAQMRAPASLPLIMEPESRFYGDPVIVLDFQSLYPSMMIAYNYCFSTCLGRVEYLIEKEEFKFGCTELKVSLKDLLKLDQHIHISPAGVAFVDSTVRKGVLPRMLEEILNTRLMVKGSMKSHKNDKLLQKILHARQLGLKLIANVTYGYTSANFSGRMPCIEIGDSVVSKGRETLERAIRTVESTERWGARVVYGDTDSLFVLCPGRTRQEAFIIGQQIADTVTQDNPAPVKLKLEKVYQPCILQTKKRYVGFMYESGDQETPTYDAKGIETVRRDGCPATSKILEKSLKILFESQDVSKVKSYVRRQLTKVLSGRLSVQELTFAREYRGMAGYQPGACVPALKIARERLARDRRSEPRRSERVGYVITAGPPGTPLIRLARSLEDFIADPTLCISGDYYARKAILPPLDRCFTLLGVDVFSWYTSLPRKQLLQAQNVTATGVKKATIAQYFATVNCIICSTLTKEGVCKSCQQQPQILAAHVFKKISNLERKEYTFKKICESCCGRTNETSNCVSTVCPVYYQRLQSIRDNQYSSFLRNIVGEFIPYEF